jgi:hypothetical protein
MAYALRLDSLRSSHPIQVPISRAEEVEQVFDGISYCKVRGPLAFVLQALVQGEGLSRHSLTRCALTHCCALAHSHCKARS